MAEHERLFDALAQSTRLWADADQSVREDGWWAAMSGHRHVGYNVALCHAHGARTIPVAMAHVATVGVPAVVMLAADALGDAQVLPDAGWVCVGVTPLMSRPVGPAPSSSSDSDDAGIRLLGEADRDIARSLVAEAFDLDAATASVALPDRAFTSKDILVTGLEVEGEVVSAATAVLLGDVAVVWSTATPPARQRRGLGRRLMAGLLVEVARQGAETALLYSSPAGRALYEAAGFTEVTPLQIWSRPRWVLGGFS